MTTNEELARELTLSAAGLNAMISHLIWELDWDEADIWKSLGRDWHSRVLDDDAAEAIRRHVDSVNVMRGQPYLS